MYSGAKAPWRPNALQQGHILLGHGHILHMGFKSFTCVCISVIRDQVEVVVAECGADIAKIGPSCGPPAFKSALSPTSPPMFFRQGARHLGSAQSSILLPCLPRMLTTSVRAVDSDIEALNISDARARARACAGAKLQKTKLWPHFPPPRDKTRTKRAKDQENQKSMTMS